MKNRISVGLGLLPVGSLDEAAVCQRVDGSRDCVCLTSLTQEVSERLTIESAIGCAVGCE